MNEILKEFLNKDIAREIYFIPCSIDEKEINDFIEQMQNKAIERGTTPTLNSYHHTLASEFLGKGVIIAFEFQGIEGALKFMIDTTIKAQEKMINDNIENGYLAKKIVSYICYRDKKEIMIFGDKEKTGL